MGCKASKSTDVVVVPMPQKLQQNLDSKTKETKVEKEDSLRGSQSSLTSSSNASRSDRENSAKSTRTTDSGVGELEDDKIITEHSNPEKIREAKLEDRPLTPELSIDGTTITRRKKSPKERQVAFSKDTNNNSTNLIDRPASRVGVAFDVELYPDTHNVKRRPLRLQELEKKRKSKRKTKEEIKNKLEEASERRMEHNNQVIERATLSRKERQLKEARALDEFAQRLTSQQESQESTTS